MPAALDDLVILDFSRVLAGPLATMVLADLGATVIKVERPARGEDDPGGDDTRSWGPPYDADGVATYFLSVNRNKRSVALDLRDPGDLARARALAAGADVVVENFRPGVMDRLGLGYGDLAREHPQLVYCSITGFGRGGGAAMPGYDLLVQAVGGLMSVTGSPDGEPQKVGVALVDVICGLFAATGILAALRHRERTGEGQRVEVDLLSSLLAALVNQASAVTAGGAVPARMGNAHPSIAPYELYPARGGDLVIACGNDRQFAALCRVCGLDRLARDPDFATNAARVAHRERLRDALVAALADRTPADWARELLDAGVPAGEVNDIAGAIDLARSLGMDPTVALPRHDGSTVDLVRNPIWLSATPASYRSAPPELGEG
ncbi:CAIB/BAIF family protein [Patulibacter medicamentivorans]|jgi:crotonobetainyl-CoA:carnitine CoA-transferase CaiB-like acyl-CoA transferase|uniref:CAIB/BAIF family protein n=1 Tax=Patulibacter medicamentivorans TaxID=1097667 RepID=H0E2V9_9ACTN|nr:CoA transferase [Patulibacter medicamentivorans]EHN11976.1 CAIB/BAIF family protein [Patulibacter medicamentivorans]